MPMFPSPLAAAALATVKVAGYAGFARALIRKTTQNVAPMKFGAVVLGTLWSYALDSVMCLVYKFVPGMTMPVC